ncbi:restriction endonuclease subunit S [Aurantiacibacter gilvus]|uniref:Restriction endonuclease subunit S n=1 Tax=Aurantiacibacter gilvus TaxID=3139141 RepID=A0ABU9I9K3_9SPHN
MSDVFDEPKVPKLRFPEFDGDWVRVPLNMALREKKSRNRDGRFSKSDVLSVSGEVGVVNQIAHMGRSYAGVSVSDYHIVENGDVVYTKSPLKNNPFGIIKTNHGPPGIVSTLYAVYEVREEHDPGFWGRFFELDDRTNHYLMPLVHKGAKNDMKINNARVLIDPVVHPQLSEQQKIASFFNDLDARTHFLGRRLDALMNYKGCLIQRIFSRELRFTRDDGTSFPRWEEKQIGDMGISFGGLTGKSADDFGDGLPFVTYRQVFGASSIKLEECEFVRIDKHERQNQLRYGDILLTTSSETPAEVGFASVVLDHPDQLFLNSFCFVLRPHSVDDLNPNFARYLFRSPGYRQLVYPLAQGSTRYNLSKSSFLKLRLSIPHPDEQRKIADLLLALDDKIDGVTKQIGAMQSFKKGLLQQMFV